MNSVRRFAAAAALAPIGMVGARAQVDIPAYTVLSCEKDCPPVTKAVLRDRGHVAYPQAFLGQNGNFAEAVVDIDYTIDIDGHIKNPVVEDLMGPRAFAEAAIQGLLNTTYDPATEGGKPVEENRRLRFLFRMPQKIKGARPEIVSAYGAAEQLVLDNKHSEATAAFQAIESKPDLNLYERTMVALALADAEFQAKDFAAARHAIRIATIDDAKLLGKTSIESAIRLRIRLEAINGDFAESFAWFGILGRTVDIKPDDPDQKMIDRMHAMVAGEQPLSAKGRIPDTELPVLWQHTLLRRSFEFHNVVGSLEKFELHCARHSILSPVSDTANWTVPASWSDCNINVYGTPRTTFELYEYPPPLKPAVPAPGSVRDDKPG